MTNRSDLTVGREKKGSSLVTPLYKLVNRRKDALRKNKPLRFNERGEVVLTVAVRDKGEFLSPYSTTEDALVAADLMSFLQESAMSVEGCTPIALEIYSNSIEEKDQPIFRDALINSFELYALDNERDLRKTNHTILWTGLVGGCTLILSLSSITSFLFGESGSFSALFSEVMDICSWVSLWTCVESILFSRRYLKEDRDRLRSFCKMPISFHPDEESPEP